MYGVCEQNMMYLTAHLKNGIKFFYRYVVPLGRSIYINNFEKNSFDKTILTT